ncbi:MAG: hypothetical protein H7Y22_06355 [Gemmatimonadaceae bacterium]|nr:hypothetical protein [Gloeobacterales cyanobacterium ES-bin-141]
MLEKSKLIERLAESGTVPSLQLRENLNNPDDWVIEAVRAHLGTVAPASCSRTFSRILADSLRMTGHYELAVAWILGELPALPRWQQEKIRARLDGQGTSKPIEGTSMLEAWQNRTEPERSFLATCRVERTEAEEDGLTDQFDFMGIG